MADDADVTDERQAALVDADIAAIRNRAQQMEPGKPGECVKCGEFSWRLVGGACAPCRDKFKLP